MSDPTADRPNAPSDQIRADRACAGCGFNLYGQSVTREEHYGLAIARCPECGTVAALQQYPAMTHWVNRSRMVLSAIYLLILLAFFAGGTIAMSAFAYASAEIASNPLATHLQNDYNLWSNAQQNGSSTTGTPVPTTGITWAYQNTTLQPEYIDQELDRAINDFGGLLRNMDKSWFALIVPAGFVAFAIGIFWSVALLGSSRKQAMLLPVASAGIGAAFLAGVNQPDYNNPWIWTLAGQLYIPWFSPMVLALLLIPTALGVFFGRKLARLVIRLALPPRARVSFGLLWTRDGLEMPKTNASRATRAAT